MTFTEQIITIATVVAGTMITRFLPFILFPANKKTPPLVAVFRQSAAYGSYGYACCLLTQGYANSYRQPRRPGSYRRGTDSHIAGNPAQSAADDSSRHYRLYAAGAICICVKIL